MDSIDWLSSEKSQKKKSILSNQVHWFKRQTLEVLLWRKIVQMNQAVITKAKKRLNTYKIKPGWKKNEKKTGGKMKRPENQL